MTGSVTMCCIQNRRCIDGIDHHLFAVGAPKGNTYMRIGWEHRPELAPSRELVIHTKSRGGTASEVQWSRYKHSLYEEWKVSKPFINSVSSIVSKVSLGETFEIACYCGAEMRGRCHLSLLGELLETLGCRVIYN